MVKVDLGLLKDCTGIEYSNLAVSDLEGNVYPTEKIGQILTVKLDKIDIQKTLIFDEMCKCKIVTIKALTNKIPVFHTNTGLYFAIFQFRCGDWG